jgi:hypothetical protein
MHSFKNHTNNWANDEKIFSFQHGRMTKEATLPTYVWLAWVPNILNWTVHNFL